MLHVCTPDDLIYSTQFLDQRRMSFPTRTPRLAATRWSHCDTFCNALPPSVSTATSSAWHDRPRRTPDIPSSPRPAANSK